MRPQIDHAAVKSRVKWITFTGIFTGTAERLEAARDMVGQRGGVGTDAGQE